MKKYEYKVEQYNNVTVGRLENKLTSMREQGFRVVSVSLFGESVLVTYETWRKVKK